MKEWFIGEKVKIVLNQYQQALKEYEGCVFTIRDKALRGDRWFYKLEDSGWWHPAYFDTAYVVEDFLRSEDLDI
jgi:hypothetical protein